MSRFNTRARGHVKRSVRRLSHEQLETRLLLVADWTGAGDKDWSDAANWNAAVPTTSDQVRFQAGVAGPYLSANAVASDVKISESDISIELNTFNLSIGQTTPGDGLMVGFRDTVDDTFQAFIGGTTNTIVDANKIVIGGGTSATLKIAGGKVHSDSTIDIGYHGENYLYGGPGLLEVEGTNVGGTVEANTMKVGSIDAGTLTVKTAGFVDISNQFIVGNSDEPGVATVNASDIRVAHAVTIGSGNGTLTLTAGPQATSVES